MTSLTDSDVQFVDRGYGKKYVRLLHVRREGDTHYIKEIEVSSALTLDDVRDYKAGDNSQIVATDSQKNTVYILAKKFGVSSLIYYYQIRHNDNNYTCCDTKIVFMFEENHNVPFKNSSIFLKCQMGQ